MSMHIMKRTGLLLLVAVCGSFASPRSAEAQPEFNTVKPSTTGVPGSEVRTMALDPDGNLWIAGRWPFWVEGGLAMLSAEHMPYDPLPGGGFDTGAWQVWSTVHHPVTPFIGDIEFDGNGVAWMASGSGLRRFDRFAPEGEQWHTYNAANSPLILNGVRSIDFDSEGDLWLVNGQVSTVNGALFEFDPDAGTWTSYEVGDELPWFLPWQDLNAVMVGSDDHVWLTHATLGGMAEFDGQQWTLHQTASSLGGMLEDLEGNIWITSPDSGLYKWNGSTFQHWSTVGGTVTITGLGLGLDGTVYVSTWFGGIYKMLNGTTPQFFANADNIPGSVLQTADGDIWINNYGGNGTLGTVRHYTADGQLLERFNSFNSGLPDYFVDNIQTDSSGNLWFATGEGGLSRMLGSDGAPDAPTHWRNWGNHNDQSEPYPWAGNEPMYSMFEDDEGYIWMGGNGVGKWDPKAGTFVDFWNWENSSLGVDSFISIAQDGNGDIWIASDYTGAYRLNPQTNDWEPHLFGAAFTTANYVQDMVRDLDGNLWVATFTSLHFFNGEQWFAVGSAHGSPVVGPREVEVHPDGSLWIGASNGLIRYKDAAWTIYDTTNTPMPANHVQGLDIRSDGLIGMSVHEFGPITPFPNGVLLFDGESWDVFTYETHPLPHYQLGAVAFDADGDLWVSTISEGVTEIVLEMNEPVPGDVNGDGIVSTTDLLQVLAAWGACAGCPEDLDGDGIVGVGDLLMLLQNWT